MDLGKAVAGSFRAVFQTRTDDLGDLKKSEFGECTDGPEYRLLYSGWFVFLYPHFQRYPIQEEQEVDGVAFDSNVLQNVESSDPIIYSMFYDYYFNKDTRTITKTH
jgi:hypothetical protein